MIIQLLSKKMVYTSPIVGDQFLRPPLPSPEFQLLPPAAALPPPERNTSSEALMYLSRMLTFRADEDMAAELARIPDRSEFMRRAIERALERRPPPVIVEESAKG